MIKYLFGAALLMGWMVLAVINPLRPAESDQQVRPNLSQATQPADAAPHLRQVAGELYFPRTPYWGSQELILSVVLEELDPVEHTAAGAVKWHTIDTASSPPQADAQQVEAAVTHVFFGADVSGGDPASLVVVAQVLAAEGNSTAARGDYAYFWLRDGGPDRADQWGIYPYGVEPRVEFFPYDRSPAALGYFDVQAMQLTDPWFPLVAAAGDVVLEEVVVR